MDVYLIPELIVNKPEEETQTPEELIESYYYSEGQNDEI